MLQDLIRTSIDETLTKLKIPPVGYQVERSAKPAFGDWSTNVALRCAKKDTSNRWQTPVACAKDIMEALGPLPFAQSVSIAKPGFLNFTLSNKWINTHLSDLKDIKLNIGKGRRVQVEYISANPTGPLHLGNARSGPLGDGIARVLSGAGFKVEREYYVNDIGVQVEKLGPSLLTLGFPERKVAFSESELEYQGPYYAELAQKVRQFLEKDRGKDTILGLSDTELLNEVRKTALAINLASIKEDSLKLLCNFDCWVYESEIVKSKTAEAIGVLVKRGETVTYEGAVWLKGRAKEDRDSVLIKRDQTYTYFANDLAYHLDKFSRGFDLVINIWGSNHHGHVPRLKAGIAALGLNPDRLKVILYQFVRVKQGSSVTRMSKRLGTFVTAREVLDAVGVDAMRFFLLHRSPETHVDFDLELAKTASSANPVYAVQYACARMSSILRKAQSSKPKVQNSSEEEYILDHPAELALMKKLLEFPDLLAEIAAQYTIHLLTYYVTDLASLFHQFYEQRRVLTENPAETQARLRLILITRTVLAKALELLGINAPERMERLD